MQCIIRLIVFSKCHLGDYIYACLELQDKQQEHSKPMHAHQVLWAWPLWFRTYSEKKAMNTKREDEIPPR